MQSLVEKTQSRQSIRETISRFDAPFTVKELFQALAQADTIVSRATLYRALNALCGEDCLRLVILPDGRHVYARTEKNKTLCVIECAECGKLSSRHTEEFDRCFLTKATYRNLNPLQTTIYMRIKCTKSHCQNRAIANDGP